MYLENVATSILYCINKTPLVSFFVHRRTSRDRFRTVNSNWYAVWCLTWTAACLTNCLHTSFHIVGTVTNHLMSSVEMSRPRMRSAFSKCPLRKRSVKAKIFMDWILFPVSSLMVCVALRLWKKNRLHFLKCYKRLLSCWKDIRLLCYLKLRCI